MQRNTSTARSLRGVTERAASMRTFRLVALVLALLAFGGALQAQQADSMPRPNGWHVRPDAADANIDDVIFSNMPPGWHITTGPAVIVFHPDSSASGRYRVETEIFLFDPGQRLEAFGLFIGGRNLAAEEQRYTYFMIRQDGRYLIKRRSGRDTRVVQDWTEHAAILKYADRGEGATAKNVLAIEVASDDVVFSVNGREVERLPRAGLDADGVVGLRVNHALNLHVTKLQIERR